MSSPQLGNGYTRIANELYEAILRFPFTKRELLIVLAIIRKTYGYNKKVDTISCFQLSSMVGIRRCSASTTIQRLEIMGVITVTNSGTVRHGQPINNIGLNKNYTRWKTVPKTRTVPKTCNNRPQIVQPTVPKSQHTKDSLKDIKDSRSEASSSPPAQVISIPLKDGSEYPVTQSQVIEWEQAYSRIDVMQALKKIRQWNISNPKKRKTKAGVLRHITGWLKKDQDSLDEGSDDQDFMAGAI